MNEKRHIYYSYWAAHDAGVRQHAQKQMRDLGITYTHDVPQNTMDAWMFWNCQGCEVLPSYLTVWDCDPMDWIRRGLTKEDAEAIIKESKIP